jgi:hypothetical protein
MFIAMRQSVIESNVTVQSTFVCGLELSVLFVALNFLYCCREVEMMTF